MAFNQKQAPKYLQANDVALPNPPGDSVSSLSLNGDQQTPSSMLIAGSWDKSVSCYELQYGQDGKLSNAVAQAQIHHDGPVLSTDIANDGMTVFSGGADNTVRMWNPTQGSTAQTIGQHEKAVRSVKFLPDLGLVASGSWDGTVKLWDTRQPTPASTLQLSERVHCMDARGPAMVVGTADRKITVFDLTQGPNAPVLGTIDSPLSYQTRSLSIFHNLEGFAVGSIEGRVAIHYFSQLGQKSITGGKDKVNFIFKCHRDRSGQDLSNDIYSVNKIAFCHTNTFVTAGSDGTLVWWDKDERARLRGYEQFKNQAPITDCVISPMGNLMIYSLCYDWSMGKEGYSDQMGVRIMIHENSPDDLLPKQQAARR